jgi:Ca2+-binding RTX toxin-like protein
MLEGFMVTQFPTNDIATLNLASPDWYLPENVATFVSMQAGVRITTYHDINSSTGFEGDDWIKVMKDGGTEIFAQDGDDTFIGADGYDHVEGGNGNDEIWGNENFDSLLGGRGNDRVFGGEGDEKIYGTSDFHVTDVGTDEDYLSGGEGDDWVLAGNGDDIVKGGAGIDTLWGDGIVSDESYGADKVWSGSGNGFIYGELGKDQLHGGKDNDLIDGGFGNDRTHGGQGDNTIITFGGTDVIYGGAGTDTFIFATSEVLLCEVYRFTLRSRIDKVTSNATIQDFNANKDVLALMPTIETTAQEQYDLFLETADAQDNHIVWEYDQGLGVVTINNVSFEDISVANFIGSEDLFYSYF